MALSFVKNLFLFLFLFGFFFSLPKRYISRGLGKKILQCFNLVHVHEPKFGLFCHYPFSIIFLALFLSFFSAFLGVNYGQGLEIDLDQLQG